MMRIRIRFRIQLMTLMRIRMRNQILFDADADPGYQNDADPDQDPQHWLQRSSGFLLLTGVLHLPTSFPFFFLEKPVERCRSLSQLPGACALEDHRHSLRRLDAEFTATSSRRPRLLLRVLAKSKTRTKINQNSSWFVLSSALII
jgi:hypothetical protein